MNEIEIWKDIEGYEGKYQVSNLGRIKSLKDRYGNPREKILKFGKNKNGYLYVILCKNGNIKNCKIHRLVANAFLDNPNNLPMINHKDEDKTNNIVDNLEWCDAKYNLTYGGCQQRRVTSTDWKTKVANTDYKAIVAKIDYKAFQQKRIANTDWKSVGIKNAEKQSKQVYQYSLDLKLIKIWESTKECGRNGFSQGNISECCNGKRQSHKGYIWSYEELK